MFRTVKELSLKLYDYFWLLMLLKQLQMVLRGCSVYVYIYIVPGYPSTNNGLESTNRTIKDEGTFRDRLPLHDFIKVIVPFVKDWSSDRIPELETTKKFLKKPNVETRTWNYSYNWLKVNKRIIKYNHNGSLYFMCTSELLDYDANKSRCKDFWLKSNGWQNFNEFIFWANEIRCVKINQEEWELSECSCEAWLKHLVCKHVIGVSFHLGLNKLPGVDLSIEGNAKRGRKKIANRALQRNSIGPLNTALANNENNHNDQPIVEQQDTILGEIDSLNVLQANVARHCEYWYKKQKQNIRNSKA
ncbi:hypothetical protein BpHYR1_008019 [Brachionus plicatilis]|uniref:SWIM-type domain-containing protein n=1 Tax=Brachionus plicatilis TaxID=10195 RepID=A0A3M7PKP3_BRAPC|nr:hypothetical protein BpHYR1_008019 [Brachionus plicatilis]